jgi:hypothetical protein
VRPLKELRETPKVDKKNTNSGESDSISFPTGVALCTFRRPVPRTNKKKQAGRRQKYTQTRARALGRFPRNNENIF